MNSNDILQLVTIFYVQAELHNYTLLQFLGKAVPVLLFYFNFNNPPVCPM